MVGEGNSRHLLFIRFVSIPDNLVMADPLRAPLAKPMDDIFLLVKNVHGDVAI